MSLTSWIHHSIVAQAHEAELMGMGMGVSTCA